MSSAQVGKTEILNNIVGYIIDQSPAPVLLLQPTLEMAHAWSKDRLAPMLRDTPCLTDTVKDPKSRNSGNRILHKTFPGGHITMAGANSPASLASRPIRDVLCDEVDRYPASAGSEGDPVNLARKRSTTYPNRKLLLTSTPTTRGASRIEMAYDDSSQGKYFVPCPHCNQFQVLQWANVQWEKEKKAYYVCDIHGCIIEEKDKQEMVRAGEWRHANEAAAPGVVGFHINELYSSWRTWDDIRTDFLSAKKNTETLKTWVNTTLGETWEDEGITMDPHALYERREDYELPIEVKALTIGVDVQKDRLEYEIVGWGAGLESWGIRYGIIMGDPDHREVWESLTQVLEATYTNDDGIPLSISAGCIDSGGHHTQVVYDYCARRPIQRFYAIKGMAGEGRAIVNPRDIIGYPHRRKVIIAGVDTAKATMIGSLNSLEVGDGYSHFPIGQGYDEEYFYQLTAEKLVTKFIRGFPKREWIKMRARNEACDCRVYNYCALGLLNPDLDETNPISYSRPPKKHQTPEGQVRESFVNSRKKSSWMNRR